MDFLHTSCLVLTCLAIFRLHQFLRNVRAARKTGLKYCLVPFLETEIVAQLATPILRRLYTDQLDAGDGWPSWCRFMIKDWSWEDKRLAHDQYGDVFLVVSPAGIICYVADADVSWDVMNRRYDFTKPRDKYSTSHHDRHTLSSLGSSHISETEHRPQKYSSLMVQMWPALKAAPIDSTSA